MIKAAAKVKRAKKAELPAQVPEVPRTGPGRPKGPDLTMIGIGLAPGLLERIDGWRFANKADSRSAAIRALLERGLKP